MAHQAYFSSHAFLTSGWATDVRIEVSGGKIDSITPNGKSGNSTVLGGPTLPTIANLHSHAFQYVMAGLAEVSRNPDDSFWSWRDLMYKLVGQLSPDDVGIIATQLYIDMLKAGYTQVGEFHYLWHDHNGSAYANATEMPDQLFEAANRSGIGMTFLPTLYSHSGFGGQAPTSQQKRFINNTEQYLKLFDLCAAKLANHEKHRLGVCFHSLRAVTEEQILEVLAAVGMQHPIHLHIAEQEKEVNDCLAWCGQRPLEWLSNTIELNPQWCLIHATHLNTAEINTIAHSGAVAGICPTTEANLGDGIFPGVDYIRQRGGWGIGSDSHVSLSITAELRSLEYSQRLRDRRRNRFYDDQESHIGDFLFRQAHLGGNQACAVNMGLQVGQRADFMVLDPNHPFIGSSQAEDIINRWVFASNENLVKHVYVAGKAVIQDFSHPLEEQSRIEFGNLIKRVMRDW